MKCTDPENGLYRKKEEGKSIFYIWYVSHITHTSWAEWPKKAGSEFR